MQHHLWVRLTPVSGAESATPEPSARTGKPGRAERPEVCRVRSQSKAGSQRLQERTRRAVLRGRGAAEGADASDSRVEVEVLAEAAEELVEGAAPPADPRSRSSAFSQPWFSRAEH